MCSISDTHYAHTITYAVTIVRHSVEEPLEVHVDVLRTYTLALLVCESLRYVFVSSNNNNPSLCIIHCVLLRSTLFTCYYACSHIVFIPNGVYSQKKLPRKKF